MPRNAPPRKDKNRVPRKERSLPAAPKKDAERVAKVIARAGLGSRREIEDWIAAGRVAVNGEVLATPAVTVTQDDAITVDGAPLPERERTRLFLYHKPRGVVTTNRDPEGRTTLFEILPGGLPRLVSVGRLDLNSEGLLLLTNDGGLARVLELPETGWLRRYRVRANGEVDQAKLDTLIRGITVEGVEYGPIEAVLDRVQGANAWLTVSLREGKNREVRVVLAALGLTVNRLIRTSYGPFQLGDVPEGAVEEVRTRVLREQIGAELSAAAGADFEAPIYEREIEEAPPRPRAPVRGKGAAGGKPEASARPGRGRRAAEDAIGEAPPRPARSRRPKDEERALESLGTVADRKGRTVKVERIVAPKGAEAERAAPRRGGRFAEGGPAGEGRFGRSRTAGADGPARRGRPAGPSRFRDDEGGAERPARKPRDGYAGRSERPYGEGGGERPARGPRRERSFEQGDAAARPQRRGPARDGGEREARGERPFRSEGRPGGDRPHGRGGKSFGGKSFGERSAGEKPAFGGRKRFEGEATGEGRSRPAGKPRFEKGSAERPARASGDAGASSGRPERRPRADGPAQRSGGFARQDREGGASREDFRSGGPKPGGRKGPAGQGFAGKRSAGTGPGDRGPDDRGPSGKGFAGKGFAGKGFAGKGAGGKGSAGRPSGRPSGGRPSGGRPSGGRPAPRGKS